MKKLILAVALLTLANVGYTAPCSEIAKLAESIMTSRQSNIDMVKMYAIADKAGGATGNVTKAITKAAYSRPLYSTQEYKEKHIRKFKNDVFLQCLKSEEKNK